MHIPHHNKFFQAMYSINCGKQIIYVFVLANLANPIRFLQTVVEKNILSLSILVLGHL